MADSSSLPVSSDIARIKMLYHANCTWNDLRLCYLNGLMQKKKKSFKRLNHK